MTSISYIVKKWHLEEDKEETLLNTEDMQAVVDYLLEHDIRERDRLYVNGVVGSEWLYDNYTSKQS